MKPFFTSLFYVKTLVLSLFFVAPLVASGQVVFTQNFDASTTLSTYIGSGTNLFDYIGTSGSTSFPYVTNVSGTVSNRLQLERKSGASAWARTTPFSSTLTPTVLEVKFKLNVPFCPIHTASNGIFYVGSGFTADAATQASSHSRFGVFFTAASTWCVRQVNGTTANGPNYAAGAEQSISWYINNSGSSFDYTDPAGGTTSLANDVADLWVGTSRVFAAIPTGAATQDLNNIKLYSANNVSNAISVDNIVITALTSLVLPVSISSFTANKADAANQLTWATATEQNAVHFIVERSNDAQNFVEIGKVSAQGKAATYNFEDKTPLSISYYRLRQVDFDGTETLSKVVSVRQSTKGRISITPNPTSDKINIYLNQDIGSDSKATMTLYDVTGRQVLTQTITTDACQLDLSNLAKGVYVLTVQSNNAVYQEKIIRQ
jgi:Secretion system C-terminal sorting domain